MKLISLQCRETKNIALCSNGIQKLVPLLNRVEGHYFLFEIRSDKSLYFRIESRNLVDRQLEEKEKWLPFVFSNVAPIKYYRSRPETVNTVIKTKDTFRKIQSGKYF